MVFFFGLCGLIFVLYISSGPGADADMRPMFHSMLFLSLIVSPVLTMGLLSTERATGTIELLMTKPVRDIEVAIGKYLAAMALYAILLLVSLEFPLAMAKFGHLDWSATMGGYLGLLLCGVAFMSIGVFASSITDNQIAAIVVGLLLLLFFWLIGFLGAAASPTLGDVAKHISILENFQDLEKGIIDTKSILYFLSLAGFMIFLAVRSLENRRTV
jgi:ABC-2 type transport system permease protein